MILLFQALPIVLIVNFICFVFRCFSQQKASLVYETVVIRMYIFCFLFVFVFRLSCILRYSSLKPALGLIPRGQGLRGSM